MAASPRAAVSAIAAGDATVQVSEVVLNGAPVEAPVGEPAPDPPADEEDPFAGPRQGLGQRVVARLSDLAAACAAAVPAGCGACEEPP